jgi:hypothetical protein
VGDSPSYPGDNVREQAWKDHFGLLAAALPAEWRVLDFGELSRAARRGWAGEKSGLFEHPVSFGYQFHVKGFNDALCVSHVFL